MGAALPDSSGVPLRWGPDEQPILVPWGATPRQVTALLGQRAVVHDPTWITVANVVPFAHPDRQVRYGFSFTGGDLRRLYVFIPSSSWSASQWVTDELTAAHGPVHEHRPAPFIDDYETDRWTLPGLTVTHGLFAIYAGPSEAAEERIEYELTS